MLIRKKLDFKFLRKCFIFSFHTFSTPEKQVCTFPYFHELELYFNLKSTDDLPAGKAIPLLIKIVAKKVNRPFDVLVIANQMSFEEQKENYEVVLQMNQKLPNS